MSAQPPAVVVDGVSKTFVLPHERVHTLKERALHPFRSTGSETLHALRDVSFEVRARRVLRDRRAQRLRQVDAAEVPGRDLRHRQRRDVRRRAHVGVHRARRRVQHGSAGARQRADQRDDARPDAAGGRRRFDHIVDFAELRPFVDLKLKNYSSGMLVRLAFAVMIQVDADILLIDEVLAVGDAAFQQKCFDEFGRIRAAGTTVLLVTHDMGAVQRFCRAGDAARGGARRRDRRPAAGRQPLSRGQLREGGRATSPGGRGGARPGPLRRRPRGDPRRPLRGRARRAGRRPEGRTAVRLRLPGALHRGGGGPDLRLRAAELAPRHRLHHQHARRPRRPGASRPARRSRSASSSTAIWRPTATAPRRRWRGRAPASPGSTGASASAP